MRGVQLFRVVALVVLILLIATAAALLTGTPHGRQILHNPHAYAQHVRDFVASHPIKSIAAYVGLYIVLTLLALPVWWLQIFGGYGFGLVMGVIWSQVGGTIGAPLATAIARWIGADWFHAKVESRMDRLRKLDEMMGHNGLLVVMGIRLAYVIPFGLSNYLFGLTSISTIDVALGTLLGNIPSVTAYVTLGADHRLLTSWRYLAMLAAINVLLLLPLAIRYLWPHILKKIGVE